MWQIRTVIASKISAVWVRLRIKFTVGLFVCLFVMCWVCSRKQTLYIYIQVYIYMSPVGIYTWHIYVYYFLSIDVLVGLTYILQFHVPKLLLWHLTFTVTAVVLFRYNQQAHVIMGPEARMTLELERPMCYAGEKSKMHTKVLSQNLNGTCLCADRPHYSSAWRWRVCVYGTDTSVTGCVW
jgi:hypothetical protein